MSLQNRGRDLDMNVREAWELGATGRNVVVTILDDGIEKDHPDLKRNYVSIVYQTIQTLDKRNYVSMVYQTIRIYGSKELRYMNGNIQISKGTRLDKLEHPDFK